MREETVDIFKGLVKDLTPDLVITNVIANVDGTFTLETKCTWWLSIKMIFNYLGNEYVIEDFVINQSITVKQSGHAVVPIPGTQTLSAPQFIHGTLKMAQNEVDGQPDKTILCPFVYLFEVLRDDENTDEESMIERETETRLFFLNSVDSPNWLTGDHYKYFVKPMRQMVDLFVNKMKLSARFTNDMNYTTINLINVSEDGTQNKGIFDCNLSGIELRLFAEIRENLSCINKCSCN
jgi:hypothetical protein